MPQRITAEMVPERVTPVNRHGRRLARRRSALLRLDIGARMTFPHFSRVVGDELAEVGGRSHQRRPALLGQARLHGGLGKAGVDLLVERVDDLGGRVLGGADAPANRWLRSRARIRRWRDLRQLVPAGRGRDRQRAQLAGLEVLDRADEPANIACTWPPSRSVNASTSPRYTTSTMSTPAIILNSSPARWNRLPLPPIPMLILSGLALA